MVDSPAFFYTIPTFQNPTGRTLPADARERLAALARAGMLVFEDDPYGLVRFEGEAPPTVFELAGGENVVYSSSFSKTISPGLRVGYLVLPEGLAAEVEAAAAAAYITPALLSTGDRARVSAPRQPRTEPRACLRACSARAGTR